MARTQMTKGQVEAEICRAVTQFEKEHMGRGPLETKTFLVDDMVIIRLQGILTRAELALVRSERSSRGRELVKQMRIELLESGRPFLDGAIRAITRRKVRSLHVDISTVTGEKMIVLILEKAPDLAP